MRIDKIDNKVFDDPVPSSTPSEGLNLNSTDSPNSLSSPFRNPYGNFGNFAGNVSSRTTGNTKGLTAAERNNNPFNIKFGKFAAKFGATKEDRPALDGGSFATFPTVDAGFAAAKDLLMGKNYRGLTVDQAMKRWSNKGYGGEIYPDIAAKRVSDLSENEIGELQRRQVVREDRNYAKKLGFLTNLPKYAFGGDLPKPKTSASSTAVARPIARPAIDRNNIGQEQFESPDTYRSLTGDKRPLVKDLLTQSEKLRQYNQEQGDYYRNNTDSILIKDSRFNKRNNQRVNKAILTDILNASKKTGVDPYVALSVAQRESGIGHWSNKDFGDVDIMNNPSAVFSNWHGQNLGLNRQEFEGYTDPKTGNRHITPQAYSKATSYVAGVTRFPFAGEMQTLKEKGIRGYNPGDPNYEAKVQQERAILMSPENKKFRTYVDSVYNSLPAYRYGGCLPKMASGGLVPLNPRSYNTNNQLANGLSRYTTQQQLGNVIQQNSVTPTAQTGGGGMNANLIGMGLGLAGEAVGQFDSNPEKVNQTANIGAGILKGAASGAVAGSVIPGWGTAVGAVVGAAAGGVTSAIKGNKRKKAIEAGIRNDQRNFNILAADRSAQAYRQYQPYQYKFGGNTALQPTYEVEKDEVIQGSPILEEGRELADGLVLVGGNKHSKGGTLGTGEGRVFSNSISFTGGKTPAVLAKKIGNQMKKYQKNLSSKDHMKRATAEVMTDRLNEDLDDLYQAQEQYKMMPQFKYGGQLPKLADGGNPNIERKRKQIQDRIKTLDRYLKDNPKRQAIGGYDPKDDLRKERTQLQGQLDNPAIWRGDIFNPLDNTKNVAFPDRVKSNNDIAWTNDLKPVNIKGKRNIPTPKPIRRTQPQITRTDLPTPNELIPQPMSVDTNLDVINRNGDEIFNRINADKFKTTPIAPKFKRRGMGLKIDEDVALPVGLSAIGYLNSARSINQMDTNAPANMINSPYYGYIDRSRLARHDLSSTLNTVLNNPNINAGRRQAIFASGVNAMNQINDQENSNRFAYDNDYNARALQVNAQNNAILNQSQAQRIANRNVQQGLRDQNFSNFLGNINTTLAERNARNLDERKFKVISDSYRRQYGTDFGVTLQ